MQPFQGWLPLRGRPRGSSFLATPGWMINAFGVGRFVDFIYALVLKLQLGHAMLWELQLPSADE